MSINVVAWPDRGINFSLRYGGGLKIKKCRYVMRIFLHKLCASPSKEKCFMYSIKQCKLRKHVFVQIMSHEI